MAYIDEILQSMNDDIHRIPYENFKRWAESTSLEDLEMLSDLIFKKSFYEKIDPYLSLRDYQKVLLPYFKRCIIEDHETDGISTRYEACWALRNWFEQLWQNKEENISELIKIKVFLSDIYENNDEGIRLAIVNGTLEHLFENGEIASFFADWKDDIPTLSKAYEDALSFSR